MFDKLGVGRFPETAEMENGVRDPWNNHTNHTLSLNTTPESSQINCFEDCFVTNQSNHTKLPDSDEYLKSLYSKLRAVQGGSSKKDLINSLAAVKEDCVARFLTDGYKSESAEEAELAANPLVRHIAPHLQALTASELVELLKSDVLQDITDKQHDLSSVV